MNPQKITQYFWQNFAESGHTGSEPPTLPLPFPYLNPFDSINKILLHSIK